MRMIENIQRIRQLVDWYGSPDESKLEEIHSKVGEAWDLLWETREPRLIPIDTDGVSQLTIHAIETYKALNSNNHPDNFLEIGCGPASRSIQIAKKYDLELFLLDTSSKALSLQAIPLAQTVSYLDKTHSIQGDMLHLPFADNSLDIVFAYGPHDHFFNENRQKTFDEMYRINSKDGMSVVILPSQLNMFWTAEMIKKVWDGTWNFGPTKFFTPGELVHKMKQAGYKDVTLLGASFFTSWLRVLPKEEQVKRYDNPTKYTKLNEWLNKHDKNFYSFLNRYCGGDMMVVGIK